MGKEVYQLRTRVYVAGPITLGDVDENIRQAIAAGKMLLDRGYAPFVPHLSHFAEPLATWMVDPLRYEIWLDLDRSFIAVCDALLRIPGESRGADREVAWAVELGIPVFHTLDVLYDCIPPTRAFEVSLS